LNKRIPLDSGKEATKKVWVEICFTKSELYIAKFERKIVGSATFGMARKEIVGDKTDHDPHARGAASKKGGLVTGNRSIADIIKMIKLPPIINDDSWLASY
jgi:hypothetical protein